MTELSLCTLQGELTAAAASWENGATPAFCITPGLHPVARRYRRPRSVRTSAPRPAARPKAKARLDPRVPSQFVDRPNCNST